MLTCLRAVAVSCVALATTAACSSEDDCGTGGLTGGDVLATVEGGATVLRYRGLVARANNDCPDPAAPAGVVSLTLSATQVGGTVPLTFCVPRPDLLAGSRALGADVQVIDVFGAADGCSYRLAAAPAPTGTVTASGVCGAGRDPAGFALDFAGQVTLERTCGSGPTANVTAALSGAVAVLPSSN